MDLIPLVSIIIEIIIAAIALVVAYRGHTYMIGFAITFGIYVYYDLARYYAWEVSESLLSGVFFIATLAALVSMMGILKKSSKKK